MTTTDRISASDIADLAAGKYLACLTAEGRGRVPENAPAYGSGEQGANPYPPDSRENDLYEYSWRWASMAESEGRAIALDHEDADGPWIELFRAIFKEAHRQTREQFGMDRAAA